MIELSFVEFAARHDEHVRDRLLELGADEFEARVARRVRELELWFAAPEADPTDARLITDAVYEEARERMETTTA